MWYEILPHCPICDTQSPPHKLCVSQDQKIMIVAVCPTCKKCFESIPNFSLLLTEIQNPTLATIQ